MQEAVREVAPPMKALAGVGHEFGIIDYSNSKFHSGLVVKHDVSHPASGLHTGQDDAFDQADAETLQWEAYWLDKLKTQTTLDRNAM